MIHRHGFYGSTEAATPVPFMDFLPSIGTAVGNALEGAKSPVQRAAEYEANLRAAIAKGAPLSVVEQWKNKLEAVRYEVAQQQAWDTQQQQVLNGIQILQATGVLVGLALTFNLVARAVR